MKVSRRRRGRKGLPSSSRLARVDGVRTRGRRPAARRAPPGARPVYATPSGSEASPAMPGDLSRAPGVAKIRMCETAHA